MNRDVKEKLEEALETAIFNAYGDCHTIDGVRRVKYRGEDKNEYEYGGFIAAGDQGINPRGIRELKADPELKKMGIEITDYDFSRDAGYERGERDVRIYFTLNNEKQARSASHMLDQINREIRELKRDLDK